MLAASLGLCACTTAPAPPLFFGELVTVGINIGTGAGTQGVDFTLGYKDQDLAVVPVGAVSNGKGQAVIARTRDGVGRESDKDALSVFGQFEGQGAQPVGGASPVRKVALGRFFATGLAATNLAEGYRDGWAGRRPGGAGPAPAAPSRSVTRPAKTPEKQASEGTTDQQTAGSPQPDAGNQVYVPPLVFAQTNTLGMGISTEVAEQGVQFSLGYTGRDIAFVPVMIRSADGSAARLGGRHDNAPIGVSASGENEDDALSVFGQFRVDTATESVQFGLRRFFTTGMAARRLTEGFKSVIARELQAEQAATASDR